MDLKTPGSYPTAPSSSSIPTPTPEPSKLEVKSAGVEGVQPRKTEVYLEWVMVLAVLLAACYMAIKNNTPDIIFNLCTLCFGYYFRSITNREQGAIK